MAGNGPPPKPIEKLAGHGAAKARANVLRFVPATPQEQPDLPPMAPMDVPWCSQTRSWWKMWKDSPLSTDFTDNDWSELMDAAILHNRLWTFGDLKSAAELRLRVSKFGATPEDRAKLRIQFAIAAKTEGQQPNVPKSTKQRRLVGSN